MKSLPTIVRAQQVLETEFQAIKQLSSRIDKNFESAVEIVANCKGKVVVTGMGKSGLIGRKIAATLASTGTPAFYLHPAEGLHGDIGMLMKNDCVLAISYSGETNEIIKIIPNIKRLSVKLVTMTGNKSSALAKASNAVLDIKVSREACPYNIAPTASTTACLALGDALSLCVMDKKGIRKEDFNLLHPAGTIGKKLLLRIQDIMHQGKNNPVINENKSVKEALFVMTQGRLGAVSVINKTGKLVGYFTDGDLRRWLQKDETVLNKHISEIMTRNPATIQANKLAVEAAVIFEEKKCDNLPVVDGKGTAIGIIDERDLLAEGII